MLIARFGMFVLFFTTCNHGDKRMQEKDALLGERLVTYYRKNAIDPPIFFFQGSLDQFLQLPEIDPYGEILEYSRDTPREAIVVAKRRDKDCTVLIAKERERD